MLERTDNAIVDQRNDGLAWVVVFVVFCKPVEPDLMHSAGDSPDLFLMSATSSMYRHLRASALWRSHIAGETKVTSPQVCLRKRLDG